MDEVRTENRGEDISAWIRAAAAGSRPALDRLVGWLSPMMLGWARLQTGSGTTWPILPEDVVQDVWLRVLPKLPQLEPHAPSGGRMTPALLGVVRRVLRDRVIDIRRAATRDRLRRRHDGSASGPDPVSPSSGPIGKAERSEDRRLVEQALDRLTHKERALYLKRLFEEYGIDDLCAEFAMSREAVIKARQRVRQKLAEFLSPHFLDELEAVGDE